ncbi:MAG: DUF1684 domain-containing protein [Cyclobacteriaceae bacterium]|nr:DUF1684 domain-containing protein [Cyclobacteriaceae bacterium]
MKKQHWIIFIPILIVIGYLFFSPEDDASYRELVNKEIDSRKKFLEFNEQSPFRLFNEPYTTPSYFEIDPSYKVTATIEKINERQFVTLETSTGEPERYLKYAYLVFNLQSQPLRLLVLKPAGLGAANVFFCAFADATSGTLTYGGGRYLDVTLGKSQKTTLDFNLAYNPYCAYVSGYSCPLPPPENTLPISILAGEKIFKNTH